MIAIIVASCCCGISRNTVRPMMLVAKQRKKILQHNSEGTAEQLIVSDSCLQHRPVLMTSGPVITSLALHLFWIILCHCAFDGSGVPWWAAGEQNHMLLLQWDLKTHNPTFQLSHALSNWIWSCIHSVIQQHTTRSASRPRWQVGACSCWSELAHSKCWAFLALGKQHHLIERWQPLGARSHVRVQVFVSWQRKSAPRQDKFCHARVTWDLALLARFMLQASSTSLNFAAHLHAKPVVPWGGAFLSNTGHELLHHGHLQTRKVRALQQHTAQRLLSGIWQGHNFMHDAQDSCTMEIQWFCMLKKSWKSGCPWSCWVMGGREMGSLCAELQCGQPPLNFLLWCLHQNITCGLACSDKEQTDPLNCNLSGKMLNSNCPLLLNWLGMLTQTRAANIDSRLLVFLGASPFMYHPISNHNIDQVMQINRVGVQELLRLIQGDEFPWHGTADEMSNILKHTRGRRRMPEIRMVWQKKRSQIFMAKAHFDYDEDIFHSWRIGERMRLLSELQLEWNHVWCFWICRSAFLVVSTMTEGIH